MSIAGRGRFDEVDPSRGETIAQEMSRRLNNIVRVGTVEEVSYDPPRVRVKIGPLKTAWLPWEVARAGKDRVWNPPAVGEQVTVLSPSGDLAQGTVMASAIYQDKYPPPSKSGDERVVVLEDGTREEHNTKNKTRTLTLPEGGTYVVKIGEATLTITEDAVISKVGDAKHTVKSGSILSEVGSTMVKITNGKVFLGGEDGSPVLTEAGPSSVVFAKV